MTAPAAGATPPDLDPRPLPGTSLVVSALTFGTSTLGRDTDRRTEQRSVVRHVLSGPVTTIDTGNNYADGRSEEVIGEAIREAGGLPDRRLVVTKVDPLPGSGDFSGRRVRDSVRESCDRLGLSRLPLVHLHDPERISYEETMAADGPVRALLSLQDDGLIEHLGVAGGPVSVLEALVRTGVFTAVVTHNRFTLLDRSAESLLDLCAERQIGVFNAAPYGGGLLSGRVTSPPLYAYRPAAPEQLAATEAMTRVCADHGVPLAAAALQLSIRDPRVTSTIVGTTSAEHLDAALALSAVPVPDGLWEELAALTPPRRVWLGPDGR